MYLILFTVLCGLATQPNMATAAALPPHKPFHEATHVPENGSDKGSEAEGSFLYVVASEEGGVETLNDDDFDITPAGHFVGFDDSQNDTGPTQTHKISPGTPDLPKPVLHAVLDEIAFAVEDDPLVREVVKTSLKSGGIPVEVLAPGQTSSNQHAILIEVFHLEDEGMEKSGEDQGNQKNNAAVTDARLTLTGLLPSENNNEVQPSGLPSESLSRLVHLVGKDVENAGERTQETRKKRNSVGSDTVAVHTGKVSSTTPGADSESSTIIPSTTVKSTAEFDKDLQLTTLSPINPESTPISKNYSSIILILSSDEETDGDDSSDERVKRQGEVDSDNSQEKDLDETTEVTDRDVDVTPTPRPSPSGKIIRRRRQAEGGSDISTVNEESVTVTILPSKVDLSTESVNGPSSTTMSNKESVTVTEENIPSTTESSEESVTSAQENIPSTTESSEESVSSTEENTSTTQPIVFSTVESISSTDVSIAKAEGSSTNSIEEEEEEESTLSVDEDVSTTTTPSLESGVPTTAEGNLITEDPATSSGEETTSSEADEDSSESDDSSESTEKTIGNEEDSPEAKTFVNADIVLDFYDI